MDRWIIFAIAVFIFCVLYTAWCLYAAAHYYPMVGFLAFATFGIWCSWRIGSILVGEWHKR